MGPFGTSNARLDLAQIEFERDFELPAILRMLRRRVDVLQKYSALGAEQAREAARKARREKGMLGAFAEDLGALLRLLRAWVKGQYRVVPWKTIILALVAVIYFVDPFDLVPDFVPLVGYVDDKNALVAMAIVVSDLLAARVWHVGLFIVATSRHGTGLAQELYDGLEAWAAANGATWLRLGVVKGNARAERFWERQGFIQVRLWHDVKMGRLTNTLRTMVKPLTGESIEIYLSRVERDRPEAEPDT